MRQGKIRYNKRRQERRNQTIRQNKIKKDKIRQDRTLLITREILLLQLHQHAQCSKGRNTGSNMFLQATRSRHILYEIKTYFFYQT